MKKNNSKTSYYRKILLALLVVNLVPTLFLGGSIINLVQKQKQAVNRSLISAVDSQMKKIENNFQHMENSLIEFSLENDITQIMRTELIGSNFQIFNRMRRRMQLLVNSVSDLNEIFLFNKDKGWIIGINVCMQIDRYSDRQKMQELYQNEQYSYWDFDREYIYLVKHLPIYATPGTGIIVARFYKDAVDLEEEYKKDGSLMIVLDETNRKVAGDEQYYSAVRNAIYSSDAWETVDGGQLLRIRTDGQEYILTVCTSEYNQWKYVMVTPNTVFAKNLHQVFLMLGLVILGMLCMDGYVIYTGSRRLYMPIQELDTVVTASLPEEDLELVDKIKYIVAQNSEMKKKSRRQEETEQQLFLRKVYEGEERDIEEKDFLDRGIARGILNGSNMYMIAIKYRDTFSSNEDRRLYRFALNNMIEELMDSGCRFPLVTMNKIIYTMYYLESDSAEAADLKVKSAVDMCIRAVQGYLQLTINVGVSNCFHQIEEIYGAVQECEKALRDVMEDNGICNFYHYQKDGRGVQLQKQAAQERKRLLQAIDLGESEVCRKVLELYFQILQHMKYYRFKLELNHLVTEIMDIYEDYGLAPDAGVIEDIISYDIGDKVNSIESLKRDLFEGLLQPLLHQLHEPEESDTVIYRLAKYINENLEKNINLEECARAFNYNPNYLSRMFKQNFGKTYTDYVTALKMERSCELLAHSDISVNELAERFGYSSAQNFIRVFKKYTLLTPGQYRKKNKEDNDGN